MLKFDRTSPDLGRLVSRGWDSTAFVTFQDLVVSVALEAGEGVGREVPYSFKLILSG